MQPAGLPLAYSLKASPRSGPADQAKGRSKASLPPPVGVATHGETGLGPALNDSFVRNMPEPAGQNQQTARAVCFAELLRPPLVRKNRARESLQVRFSHGQSSPDGVDLRSGWIAVPQRLRPQEPVR